MRPEILYNKKGLDNLKSFFIVSKLLTLEGE